ncbi:MAG TPA: hypothetical protein VHC95_08880 [Opitutales bacterium]|nr:hypothetical protein [Opitutales bacterium]
MRMRACFLVLLAAVLTGCNHPYARLSTLQDPKYPVGRDSKIALADTFNPQTADLANRLAGETIVEQLHALGFHVTPAADADYSLSFSVADKDVSESYTVNVPTISNMVGTAGDRSVTGTVFGEQAVAQTRMVSMTQLDLWLQRTHDPKVEVWRGRIAAPAAEVQLYRATFFRALLEQVGATMNGAVQLDQAGAK